MEEYPEEMRTPPVALVSLVGCPELHPSISTHLHSDQPPINTLALPDFSKISIMAKTPKDNPSSNSGPPGGILKRDWLLKHRTRVPAVVAVLISSDHVSGDPAQWLQVCTDLENLKYDFLNPLFSYWILNSECLIAELNFWKMCLTLFGCECWIDAILRFLPVLLIWWYRSIANESKE